MNLRSYILLLLFIFAPFVCGICPAKFGCDNAGGSNPVQCQTGWYSPTNHHLCHPCEVGMA